MSAFAGFPNQIKALSVLGVILPALALGGCDQSTAEKSEPLRPVLVAQVHYQPETPERSFVGTIRPRIETDMGFRVAGKVEKRLVEVGQVVEPGQALATLDQVDLKLQAEQAQAELSAATGTLAQAAAAQTRAKELKARAGPPTRSSIRPMRLQPKRAPGSTAPNARSNSPTTACPTRR
jgi:multidrug efflux pump subunit AcrA (membrane-fusion protein)